MHNKVWLRWAPEIWRAKHCSKWRLFWISLFGRHDYKQDDECLVHIVTYRGVVYVLEIEYGITA